MVPPALRAALWLWALLLVALPRPTPSLGLFFRTSWAHEVRQPDSSTSTIIGRRFAASSRATSPQPQPHSAIPARQVSDEVFDSWFELIARGRAEGPSSPYYVDILGIQSVACSQAMPLGPPCNATAPTGSHQARGNESMAYAEIFHRDVAKLAKHFHLFDKVYVGSLWPDELDLGNATRRSAAIATQARVLSEFHASYGDALGEKLGWYQTVEGSLNEISGDAASASDWLAFHREAMAAFHKIKPAQQLWSPNWEIKRGEYNASGLAAMEAHFETIFCGLDLPLALHFQDVSHY